MYKVYLILMGSVIAETIATSLMKATEGFSRLIPSIGVIIGYMISFYGLSLVVKQLDVGIAYAIWAGFGIILVSILAYCLYGQKIDTAGIIGIGFIIFGIIIINLFSKSVGH